MERRRDTADFRDGRADKLAKHNLFESPRFFADVYVLRPGQVQAIHKHAGEDKLYLILEGSGVVTTGDDRHDVGPGEVVWCPAGEDHGIENLGTQDLRAFVVMTPHPRGADL